VRTPRPTPLPWWWLAVVGLTLLALRRAPPEWIERWWAFGWVPATSAWWAPLSDLSPLPLVALWGGLLLLSWGLVVWRSRRAHWLDRLARGALPPLLALLLFDLSFAIGYRRAPLETRLGLPTVAASAEEWWGLGMALRAAVEGSAPLALERVALDAPWWHAAQASASACVRELEGLLSGRANPLPSTTRVRRLPAGLMLAGGFAGITDPLAHEVYVDGGLDPVSALQVALHEFGHAVLAAHEAEAELIGLLAAWRCDDPEVVFAGTLSALLQTSREGIRLFGAEALWAERFRALREDLPEVVGASWAAARAADARHRSPALTRVATVGYDQYLRSQGVTGGMADYSRGIALLAGVWVLCAGAPEGPRWCPPPTPGG